MLSDWARPHIGPRALLLERRLVRVDAARAAGGLRPRAPGPPRPEGRTHPARHPGARRLRARQHPDLVGGLLLRGAAPHRGLPPPRSRPVRHGRGPAAAPVGARPRRPRALRRCRTSSSATQVQRGRVMPGDASSFLTVVQGAASDFHETLGHPGSWPANWVFAWKHGVSPGRFDELFGRVPRHAWVLTDRLARRRGRPRARVVPGRGGGDRALGRGRGRHAPLHAHHPRRPEAAPAGRGRPGPRRAHPVRVGGGERARRREPVPDPRGAGLGGRRARGGLASGPQRDPLPRRRGACRGRKPGRSIEPPFAAWRLEEIAVGPVP